MRLFIIDSDDEFRAEAHHRLGVDGSLVVGETDTGFGALEAIERSAPTVVLVDAGLTDPDAPTLVGQLTTAIPGLVCVLVSHGTTDPGQSPAVGVIAAQDLTLTALRALVEGTSAAD
ncbi:MAG: hypothetical protein U0Q22_00430 [Acidimicrobiales bacterium]